jgi:outer membrane lipoprotein SlyB
VPPTSPSTTSHQEGPRDPSLQRTANSPTGTNAPGSTDNGPGVYAESAPAKKAGTAAPLCRECGVVESVQEVKKEGEGTGLGAIAGGVLGGLLGNQVGGGKGRTAMAILGAAGGAYAGNRVEKNVRGATDYQVTVRFDDGSVQVFNESTPPVWRNGDRVKLNGNTLSPAN